LPRKEETAKKRTPTRKEKEKTPDSKVPRRGQPSWSFSRGKEDKGGRGEKGGRGKEQPKKSFSYSNVLKEGDVKKCNRRSQKMMPGEGGGGIGPGGKKKPIRRFSKEKGNTYLRDQLHRTRGEPSSKKGRKGEKAPESSSRKKSNHSGKSGKE